MLALKPFFTVPNSLVNTWLKTISSAKPIFKNMKINGKISSCSNLIDFLNRGWKGLTLKPPIPPPHKWKSKAMNWEAMIQKYINIIYGRAVSTNFSVLIPTNKCPFRAISPAKWNFMGDRNYKKIHKWRFIITIMLTISI